MIFLLIPIILSDIYQDEVNQYLTKKKLYMLVR